MSLGSVFSNYEVKKLGVKLNSENATQTVAECVGSFEDECEVRIVTKNCRGVVTKERVFGTGTGTITTALHVPISMHEALYALNRPELKTGVMAYGTPNAHPEFQIVALVVDEDGNEKYLAYPKCIMETGPDMNVENGADEIEEDEITIKFMPDTLGFGKYEAYADNLSADVKAAWFENFSTDLVTAPEYEAVTPEGTENPSEEGWYELVDGSYVPTTDTTVTSGKTYYKVVGD